MTRGSSTTGLTSSKRSASDPLESALVYGQPIFAAGNATQPVAEAGAAGAGFAPAADRGDASDFVRNIERLDFKDGRIYLNGRNNALRARADSGFSIRDGVPVSIPFAALHANDRDFDGIPLTVAIPARHDAGGSVRVENGAVVYTPASGVQWTTLADFDSYTDTFFYAATDGRGGQSLASVEVTIERPSDLRGQPEGSATRTDAIGGPGGTSNESLSEEAALLAAPAPDDPGMGRRLVGGPRADQIDGTVANDVVLGGAGADLIRTGAGQDMLVGGRGDDVLDGGAGLADIARYDGSVWEYQITRSGLGEVRVAQLAPAADRDDGSDVVRNIERLDFKDARIYLDGRNNAPRARADRGFSTRDGVPVSIPFAALLANDRDFDEDPLTVAIPARHDAGGSVRVENGAVVYTPARGVQWALADFDSYTDTFFYAATDGRGGQSLASATVTIQRPSDRRDQPKGSATLTDAIGGPGGPGTESLWEATATPAVVTDSETRAVELGVKFRASVGGQITGIRFYKGPQNLGTHSGSLWSSTGTRLATATFSNETASGWQQVDFTTPVAITAGTTYVASYFAPQGRYSIDVNYFSSTHTSGSLAAPASNTIGGNGVYRYGTTSRFPTQTFRASNYWVDVVFQPTVAGNQPPIAVADARSTNEDTALTIGLATLTANDSDPDNDPLSITAVGGATNGTVILSGTNAVFTPGANYNGAAAFTYTLSDGRGATAAGTVNVTVDPVNDAPVASADSGFTTPVNTPLTVAASSLLANDTDVDGNTLTVATVGNATNGAVALNGTNIVFTPNANYTGPATFTYTVSDGNGGAASASVALSVQPQPTGNAIVLENAKPGNPASEWDLVNGPSSSIEGYAAQFSVNKGESVQFKVNTTASDYRIDIYRLGYYGGMGARKVATVEPTSIGQQPAALRDLATGLVDAGNWTVSATWAVPTDATSGVYIAKLVREDGTAGANHIPFVVRDDTGGSEILFQTSDTTWQAYNAWGGNSLYTGSPAGRAYKVSYNRPFITRFDTTGTSGPRDFLFDSEYPMIRWLEANGYDVSYFSGIDSDRLGAEIREHELFLSVGHDEYWSGGQRTNVEAARDAGVNLAFLSGNEVFWKTRWENSIDGTGTPYRTLVSYKETHANAKIDPNPAWTGTWRDPRFSPPSDGGRPENALTGQIFTVNDGSSPPAQITVPVEEGRLRFWRNTGLGAQSTTLAANILTYEWDEDLDNGSRPAGLIRLSSTLDPGTSHLLDHGSSYGSAPATHTLTLYRDDSGALVFGAGTTHWAWGLDANHDGSSPVDTRMQQATVNLFADMDVQPATLRPGLVAATASTDSTAPTSTITSPTAGSTLASGTPVTITGTASDTGGLVGGVEVSTDGGTTWHRANGRSSWTYSWTPAANGAFTIKSRAADDSVNLETPGAGVSITVGSGGGSGSTSSLWSTASTPAVITDPDAAAVELGVKFTSSVAGQITGIRFYKGPQNLGTHTGSLWTSTGTRLATTTFVNETASGWQQALFQTPVSITAGTTYVASYFAPQGKYSTTEGFFDTAYTNGPLTAPASGASGGNGVYRYSATSAFPTDTFAATNYWVDVVLQTGPANQLPVANADTATTNEDTAVTLAAAALTANDTDPDNDPLTVTGVGGATHGSVVLNGSNAIFTPTVNYNGPAGFTYTVSDGKGGTATGNVNVTVAPVNDPPVASNDSGFSTPQDTPLDIPLSTLLANDTDPDTDTLTVSAVGGAVNGSVVIDTQTASATFTPTAGYTGPASFTYTARDPSNATATGTVGLSVTTAVNRAPTPVGDAATTDEDHAVIINVLGNDTDPDGDPLTLTVLDLTGTQGAASINADNTVTYNPGAAFQSLNAGQSATDSFRYQVSDGRGQTAVAQVDVTVTGLNEPAVNPIVAENQKPGSPESEWGTGGPDPNIEGFPTDISVDQGGTISFKVNTAATDYRIDIYRMGYYGGMGARKVATVEPTSITSQPAPLTDPATGLVDAGNWSVSASWQVPTDAVSGVYIAKLVREDGILGDSHMYFVVRDDDGQSDMLFQTSDTTWHAYNLWGGQNFYTGTPSSPTQAKKVSYNRPFGPAYNSVNVPLMDAEYPMIRWLEANGYNVSYTTGVDTDRRGEELREHQAFLSVGHDEYWSNQQRLNVEAARAAGVDLAFFSGNEVYWKTRWENAIDGTGTPYRTLVTYKETWSNAKVDPDPAWTGTWRDPRFSPPSDGGRPENQVTGTIFQVDSYRTDTITVPAADGKMRFWRDTPIANLAPGQTATLTDNVLGYEWDEDRDNGFRPPSAIKLSTTSLGVSQYLLDYGNTTGPGQATHNLTLSRHPSGALTFGAGTTRWSWGLDSAHINEASTPDPRMQQATVNLFADMGIQPDSLQPGLVRASASTDTTKPTTTILTPGAGTSIPAGTSVTITGTASDVGGRVGGVEVSVDGGTTWRPANGRENWSYNWRPLAQGSATIKARATDDSLNTETAGAEVPVTIAPSTGQLSFFSNFDTPATPSVNDPNPVELGLKFETDTAGSITALRFYKGAQNTGTHVGNLWAATGTKLATATFSNESASGWQQVDLPTPVPIEPGQIYVASYHTPTGFYSADTDYFANSGVDAGPLHALATLEAGGNGVYAYGASQFPTNTFRATNYWVDVVFANA